MFQALPAIRDEARQGRGAKARPVRILHAEDDRTLTDAVGAALVSQGWKVDLSIDGAEALQRVADRVHYDLLLVGDGLAGACGLEVVRRARALPHGRRTPIIMLAAGEWETGARWSGSSDGC